MPFWWLAAAALPEAGQRHAAVVDAVNELPHRGSNGCRIRRRPNGRGTGWQDHHTKASKLLLHGRAGELRNAIAVCRPRCCRFTCCGGLMIIFPLHTLRNTLRRGKLTCTPSPQRCVAPACDTLISLAGVCEARKKNGRSWKRGLADANFVFAQPSPRCVTNLEVCRPLPSCRHHLAMPSVSTAGKQGNRFPPRRE
ncbi:hypothetical protein M409DRAFT_49981 [Zasmidium cellare ATCC 36951]|uniref:Uncharacterized protein n=1 Tax=Zasmidium cellare ATCC 36951 TaxID=1080233 RepID=A0A6A6D3M3_ZASCE|nr:uncharacterized protein M409DRAFT_49981 [Zasmidium cellare ATCC 36951]KAF2172256.1 hypothetical protein M409DRAFT_49981 [Zasmidium cellare ATCC 36951]